MIFHIIKRIITGGLLLVTLLLLAAVAAFHLVTDTTLVAMIIHRLEQATAARISYQPDAAITRTLSPTFTVNDLAIDSEDQSYSLHINSLQVQISLTGLFSGQLEIPRLALGDTRLEVAESSSAGSLAFPEPLPLHPVLHDVSIGKLSLLLAGEQINLPATHLKDLSLKLSPDGEKLKLALQTEFADREMQISATLPMIHEIMQSRLLPFSLAGLAKGVTLSSEGKIDFNPSPPRIQATIRGHAPDMKRVATGVKDFVIDGGLTAKARVNGNFDKLAIEDLSLSWQGPGQSKASLSGRMANVLQLAGLALNLTAHFDQSTRIKSILPDSLGELQSADLSTGITGSSKQLAMDDVNLQAQTLDGLDLRLSGRVDMTAKAKKLEPENVDLKLFFSAPTTRAARFLLFDTVWELGAINGWADIRSSAGDPAIENIAIQTRDSQGIAVDLTGRINSLPLDPARSNTGYDLDVIMTSQETSVMGERLGLPLPIPGPFDVRYRIEGDTQALELNQIKLSAGRHSDMQVAAQGKVKFGNWDLADPLDSIDLKAQIQSKNSKSLAALIGTELPDLGVLSASGWLHTVSGTHRIDDLLVQTGDKAPVQASLSGAVQRFTLMPELSAEGMLLSLAASGEDTAWFNTFAHRQGLIPSVGPFKVSGQISGSNRQIVVGGLSFTAGQEEVMQVKAMGRLGTLSAANNWQPINSDLRVDVRSTDSRAFAGVFGFHIPNLGPIAAAADLRDNNGKAGLESFRILVGDTTKPTLDAQGFIHDLFAARGISLEAKLNIDGHSLAAFADNHALPDLRPLTGDMVMTDDDGTLGIDFLHLSSSDSNLMSLGINGQFGDFQKPDTLSLNASLTALDLQLLGSLFDRQWPPVGPVTLSSQVAKDDTGTHFETDFTAGQTTVHSAINILLDNKPPLLDGTITARNFPKLSLFGNASETSRKKKPEDTPVFSRTPIDLLWLQLADCNLVVDIESFADGQYGMESARFEITNKSGIMAINPAKMVYPRGEINFDLRLSTQAPPQVHFTAFGTDINPWETFDLQDETTGRDFDGDVDVDVSLTSSGANAHELAANLEGKIFLTISNGKIRRQLLDMVFVDLIGWTAGKVKGDKYSDIDCGVADYSVSDGILSTNALFLDSKNIAIVGQGSIDLGKENIDYVFLPKKKSRLIQKADPVNVQGPLRNPSVMVIPWKSAARNYGGLFFAPYIFVGMVAADFLSETLNIRAKKSPCQEYMLQHKENQKDAGEKPTP